MSYTIHVTISALETAIGELKAALADFEAATKECDAAGKELLAGWEGERQKAFAEQNELNLTWFNEMATVTEVYIAALNAAKNTYIVMDTIT